MRERLLTAQDNLAEATSVLGERDMIRKSRRADLEGVTERVARGEDGAHLRSRLRASQKRSADAEQRYLTAHEARSRAAISVALAQADYDSTREGLHDLRDLLESAPDPMLAERYLRARTTYDDEASRREVEFGPQAPMAAVGLGVSPTGQVMDRLQVSGWLKSAAAPDTRTGLWPHKVNLVRRDSANARRSTTLPYLSHDPVRPAPEAEGSWVLTGEPTLGTVAQDYDAQVAEVGRFASYVSWRQHKGLPNSLMARQRWRAAQEVAARLGAFLDSGVRQTAS